MATQALVILGLPLLAFVVIVFLTWRAQVLSSYVSVIAIGIAAVIAVFLVFPQSLAGRTDTLDIAWLRLTPGEGLEPHAESALRLGVAVDPLATIMLIVVTVVSFLVQVYSRTYMIEHGHRDPGYSRFFAYLSLFTFSMLAVVLADNLLFLYVGWELVGLCSYLLIGFWYDRVEQRGVHLLPPWVAGKKAFITTRVGDVGFLVGLVILWNTAGTLQLSELFDQAQSHSGALFSSSLLGQPVIFWACLCIFAGAIGKSGQFPLHVWLPDAMEGPTPVSALIHAATMVTAGVYLIARTHPLFELAPTAADISAVIGVVTFLFAASVALVVTDLKRIIAYSTISQIGYMVVGVSIAAYSSGLFHLMTHAFFKALMFMAAGSVIAAMAGQQNIDRMSGFRRAMPITFVGFLVAALALGAFPGFSGYFSKDDILAFAAERGGGYWWIYAAGTLGALLTAVYAFRMVFRCFWGPPCPEARELEQGHLHHVEPFNPMTGEKEDTDVGFPGPEHHIAEQAQPMRAAMAALGVLALVGGLIQVPGIDEVVHNFLQPTFAGSRFIDIEQSAGGAWLGLAIGAVVSLAGIWIAYQLYVVRPGTTAVLIERLRGLHRFLLDKWYFDELIDVLVVRPALAIGSFCNRTFERVVVQGLVAGTVDIVRDAAGVVRTVQSGFVRSYALLLVAGFAALAVYFLVQSS
jgi:NADH-quinone oxidoreductase subunit L